MQYCPNPASQRLAGRPACAATCGRRLFAGCTSAPHPDGYLHFDATFIIFYICTRTSLHAINATFMFTNRKKRHVFYAKKRTIPCFFKKNNYFLHMIRIT